MIDYLSIVTMIKDLSDKHSVDADLVQAIATKESRLNPNVARYEAKWNYLLHPDVYSNELGITEITETQFQKTSWGLMQPLGTVCRELGYRGMLPKLLDPELSISYGIAKLLEIQKRYKNESDIISAYNAGSPRTIHGIYSNQAYVHDVMYELNKLRIKGGKIWIG